MNLVEPLVQNGDDKNIQREELTTYTVPVLGNEIQNNISLSTTPPSKTKPSKEQIIKQASKFYLEGNILEVVKQYQYFINQGFTDPTVFSNFGMILTDLGKLKEAELLLRKAIELKPDFAVAYSNLGNILSSLGKLKEAELSQRKAIELKPDFAKAYLNLGSILKDLGKSKEAELSIHKAIEVKPNFSFAYFNLFHNYEKINNLEKLKKYLDEFSNLDSIENEILLFRARLSFRNKKYTLSKKLIDSISNKWINKINGDQKRLFFSYKAFIEDKVGNYDIAYSYFEKSQKNPLYNKVNKDSYLSFINSYKSSILKKETTITNLNDSFDDSNLVFLIGFPRSGTTLLDTILRSHSDIEVIEEEPILQTIENLVGINFNKRLNEIYSISEDNIKTLRKKYFEILNEYKNGKGNLVIDKMPLHTSRIPIINLLFPKSKIIFTHRHPYDTVLSCFQQSFEPNDAMANFVSLKMSSIMYDQVMEAWETYINNLPLNFVASKYEDLIEDFENHTSKILNFLGAEWDENIKNYAKTALERGLIKTPSCSQVVQPLYKSSIDKWKNYEKYFHGCHKYLEKWISYFDY